MGAFFLKKVILDITKFIRKVNSKYHFTSQWVETWLIKMTSQTWY